MAKALIRITLFLFCVAAHAQILMPIRSATPAVSNSTYAIGSATGGSTTATGTNGAYIIPFVTNSGTSSTPTQIKVTGTAGTGNMLVGVYASGTTGCPSGASICAGAKSCGTTSQAFSASLMTISLPSCPAIAASTYGYVAIVTSAALTFQTLSNPAYCPGTGYYGFTASPGSFTLPTTMGTQTQNFGTNSQQCIAAEIDFSCSGSCGATTIPWAVFTYAGNAAGTTVSTTNLKNGAGCLNGTFSGTLTSATTYQTTQTHGFTNAQPCNGSAYTGGTLSIQRTASSSNLWAYNQFVGGGTNGPSATVLLVWVYNVSNTLANGDQFDMAEIGGGNITTFGAYGGTNGCGSTTPPCFSIERSGGTTAYFGQVHFAVTTWYLMAIYNVSGGPDQAAIFNTSGVEQATAVNACADGKTICITTDVTGMPSNFRMLCTGSCASTAGTWYYGPILYDPTGTSWPSVLAGSVSELLFPDSPKVIGAELSAKVEAGEIHRAEFKDGRWYSYALQRYL